MRGRRLGAGLVTILVFGGLSACARRPSGYTGVSVDPQGNPVIVMAWCGRPPKQVVVNADQTTDSSQSNLGAIVVAAPSLNGRSAQVSLRAPADGWSLIQNDLAVDDPRVTYLAYGETDSPDDLYSVYFTTAQLAKLTPSTVLGQDDTDRDVVMPISEFLNRVTGSC